MFFSEVICPICNKQLNNFTYYEDTRYHYCMWECKHPNLKVDYFLSLEEFEDTEESDREIYDKSNECVRIQIKNDFITIENFIGFARFNIRGKVTTLPNTYFDLKDYKEFLALL